MFQHTTRITVLAVAFGFVVVKVYDLYLPDTDTPYFLACVIGVGVAMVLDWIWTRYSQGKNKEPQNADTPPST